MKVGDIVLYTLSEADLEQLEPLAEWASYTDQPCAGDQLPAIVMRVWSDRSANLTLFLDGPDTCWLTHRHVAPSEHWEAPGFIVRKAGDPATADDPTILPLPAPQAAAVTDERRPSATENP